MQTTKPLPYPLSSYRYKQELVVTDIRNQRTNDFETHKRGKKKKKKENKITADAVLLQLILRDSFSIK